MSFPIDKMLFIVFYSFCLKKVSKEQNQGVYLMPKNSTTPELIDRLDKEINELKKVQLDQSGIKQKQVRCKCLHKKFTFLCFLERIKDFWHIVRLVFSRTPSLWVNLVYENAFTTTFALRPKMIRNWWADSGVAGQVASVWPKVPSQSSWLNCSEASNKKRFLEGCRSQFCLNQILLSIHN